MKDILDNLNDMFDSLYDNVMGSRKNSSHDSGDPDLDRAWHDLDQFMGSSNTRSGFQDMDNDFAEFDRRFAAGGAKQKPGADFERLKAQARAQAESTQQQRQKAEDPLRKMAEELVRAYHNLEIKPGAPVEEVKSAYKRMIKLYHPDRFANDPSKQQTATQITAKLNQSYACIMEHLGQK